MLLGVDVRADEAAFAHAFAAVTTDRVASRIQAHDTTLWGPAAAAEAEKRLGWTNLDEESTQFVPDLLALRDDVRARGLDHVVLCGMGGSSLAPEVICRAAGVELTVLDSSQPDMVRGVLSDRLDRTVVVVSSKSGTTVETDSQRRVFEAAFADAGIDPAERLVIVTDPGSALAEAGHAAGYRVFLADPDVGGRYSALSAFGLVPSALAGADVEALLAQAHAVDDAVWADDGPAASLGALLGAAHEQGVDKLVLVDHTGARLGDWIEQLIAESTGKQGRGILPVVVASADSPNVDPPTPDSVVVHLGDHPLHHRWSATIRADLGAQMLLWEAITAIAGRLIGINPFDQPDVESAKAAARELLDGEDDLPPADSVDGSIELFGSTAGSVRRALEDLWSQIDPQTGYLAVQAYLDRHALAGLERVRDTLARRTGRPVTFGWGPRFLHSTGQYHKGGAPDGVFLQITCEPLEDLAIPGRPFTFGQFCASQADGDAQVLRAKGRPVLRLHLRSPDDLTRVRELLA